MDVQSFVSVVRYVILIYKKEYISETKFEENL